MQQWLHGFDCVLVLFGKQFHIVYEESYSIKKVSTHIYLMASQQQIVLYLSKTETYLNRVVTLVKTSDRLILTVYLSF